MQVEVVPTPGLGNRSYVVHHEGFALLVDPQRDLDRMLDRVPAGAGITHVLETHVHNDYVTGGLELARRTGAAYVVAADEDVTFDRVGMRDGDVIDAGGMRVTAVSTPGHTRHHLAYLVTCGDRRVIFTGGSLLYGTVGRTDLLGRDQAEWLSRLQHRTARRLAGELPAATEVFPTHGFGSFCASAGGASEEQTASTIGRESDANLACEIEDEDEFVRTLLGGFDAFPSYYAHMAPINRAGPAPLDLSPPVEVSREEVRERQAAGEWLVDIRGRRDFAARHLRGTVNMELADTLATYLGWLMPWGTPVTILATDADEAAEAQRMIARIGIDRPSARGLGMPARLVGEDDAASYPVGDFAGLARALGGTRPADDGAVTVLDVRRDDEWRAERLAGAHHIPLHDLPGRLREVPRGEVWVHCASGYRAAMAASLLDTGERSPVLIDDDYANAAESGLEVVRG